MRLEDVKVGMWIRHHQFDSVMRVGEKSEHVDGWHTTHLGGEPGTLATLHADRWEPWTPRVGDWVLRYGTRQVVTRIETFGFEVVGFYGGRDFVHKGMHVGEPCMRPTSAAEAANAADEAPRDHNATCPNCGGNAYMGLLNVQCLAPSCDDPRTRMPHTLIETMRRGEPVWTAKGRGIEVQRPTEEGAVLAWREAVRG